ncbi:RHS repeat domain-containing protein [Rhizobacter sp. P5_C2]
MLGEYDRNGAALREYVWLRDTPMAMFTPDPANPTGEPLVYFIHSDHLNTPRVVVDRNNQVRWRWLAEPFGTSAPETNPSGLGVFTQNLRFPGQYADQESGLFYNYRRQYDSSKGGYTQSDPIGLAGGSPSTYTYVDGNPLLGTDPNGTNPAWAVYRSWRIGQQIGTELYPIIEPGLSPLIDRLFLPDLMLATTPPVAGPLTGEQEQEKQLDYELYKWRCDDDKPPPGLDKCEAAKWQLERAQQCLAQRQRWDDKWMPGRHDQAIQDVTRRVARWERAVRNECKCP